MAKFGWYLRVNQTYDPTHSFCCRTPPKVRRRAGRSTFIRDECVDLISKVSNPRVEATRYSQGGSCGRRASFTDFVRSPPLRQAIGLEACALAAGADETPPCGVFFL